MLKNMFIYCKIKHVATKMEKRGNKITGENQLIL